VTCPKPQRRPHLLLELRPEPGSNPLSDYPRLRKILKGLLRAHGFRLVRLEPVKEPPPQPGTALDC
jgi:hypothetical protein